MYKMSCYKYEEVEKRMGYRQNNQIRIYTEIILAFLSVFVLDQLFMLQVHVMQPSPFLFLVLLFSMRYGWKAGITSFVFVLIYFIALEVLVNGDVFVMFYNMLSNKWLFVYVCIAVIVGASRTAWKERYEDLLFVNEELREELKSAQNAVSQLTITNEVLEQRLLQSEMSISSVYGMMRALDQDNIEFVTNEAVAILSSYFNAQDFGIYHVDTSGRTLRIKVRRGSHELLPQTIFLEEAKQFYQRLFEERNLTVKRESDEEAAPVIAGPIIINNEVRQVLIIRNMDLYQLTEHNIQLLHWLLQVISEGAERVVAKTIVKKRDKLYTDTLIYKKAFFDEYVQIEQQRFEMYKQPYACFEVFIGHAEHEKLYDISEIVRKFLREVDKVGFDAETGMLHFLLPGTEQKYVTQLRERIVTKLKDEVTSIHGT
jgi:hypothetical protein